MEMKTQISKVLMSTSDRLWRLLRGVIAHGVAPLVERLFVQRGQILQGLTIHPSLDRREGQTTPLMSRLT